MELHAATLTFALLALAVAWIDARTRRIPDWLNTIVLLAGALVTFALQRPWLDALIGAALGYASLALLNWGYRLWRGRDGMGMGDAKFLGGAGAWLGWWPLPFVALIASSLGLAWVAQERVRGRSLSGADSITFGPFLAIAAFIAWLASAYDWQGWR